MHAAILFVLSYTATTHLPLVAAAGSDKELQPWEVSFLNTRSSSGHPDSGGYSSLDVTISDPNTIYAGTMGASDVEFPSTSANCSLQWDSSAEEPFGWVTPCDSSSPTGIWTVEMEGANATGYGPSATRDFKLRFVLEESVELSNDLLVKTFAGVGAFALGHTLSMVCGASGVCNLGLRQGTVLIQQKLLSDSVTKKKSE